MPGNEIWNFLTHAVRIPSLLHYEDECLQKTPKSKERWEYMTTEILNKLSEYVGKIAAEQGIKNAQVQSVAALLEEGGTVPFIARYRKEATGGLDEVNIIQIRDRIEQLGELDKRREAIIKSLTEQGQLSDDLKKKVNAAETLAVLEDIYLPYRPKRRTRGMIAKEKGLEPLATLLFAQGPVDPTAEAKKYVNAEKEKEVADESAALAGARDIIAEWVSEDAPARAKLRELFEKHAILSSKIIKGKEAEAAKFEDYFEWSEPAATAPSHRILAIRRGSKEGFLTFHIRPDEDQAIALLERQFVKTGPAAEEVRTAVHDSYKRLLALSMETEMRLETRKRAEEDAIKVFADNLRELLMASPMGQKAVLALDPGFRTGCKLVCLDKQGKLIFNDTIYLHKEVEAQAKIRVLVEKLNIEAIAIGNGTAGRETQAMCDKIDFGPGKKIPVILVNESGASVYSASEVARDEFPDYDLTVRGSVSIGRRLMDPLAELVKIDPKAIGVGQYQHDVDQRNLKKMLDDVVESCVNSVGVEVNTASKELLMHVAGLSERIAGNIVAQRNEAGAFKNRKALLKVAGMGPKTFEQAAGFMRIQGGDQPLDASAVHPERYDIVQAMADDVGCGVAELMTSQELRSKINLSKYISDSVGLPTLNDIMNELAKPGRDPREPFQLFSFAEGVTEVTDLKIGMKLPGVVTNVTAFGAFVDVGVHQDGLVHISQLADKFIETPADVVKVHQKVNVTVVSLDLERNRIGLSMRANPDLLGEGKPARTERTSPTAKPSQSKGAPSRPSNSQRNNQSSGGRRPDQPDTSNNPFADFFKNNKKFGK